VASALATNQPSAAGARLSTQASVNNAVPVILWSDSQRRWAIKCQLHTHTAPLLPSASCVQHLCCPTDRWLSFVSSRARLRLWLAIRSSSVHFWGQVEF